MSVATRNTKNTAVTARKPKYVGYVNTRRKSKYLKKSVTSSENQT